MGIETSKIWPVACCVGGCDISLIGGDELLVIDHVSIEMAHHLQLRQLNGLRICDYRGYK
jgi:hypothetical protein